VAERGKGLVFFLYTRVRFSLCMSVTPAMFYLSIELAGYSVDPRINRGARKLTHISWVIKKKK
jgi:hypothetical protein